MATSSETYGAMPATGYMRQSQLIPAIFPFSSATLWRKVKAGTFPKPVKLGPRITAWRVEDKRVHRPLPECSLLIGRRNR